MFDGEPLAIQQRTEVTVGLAALIYGMEHKFRSSNNESLVLQFLRLLLSRTGHSPFLHKFNKMMRRLLSKPFNGSYK